MTRRDRPTLAGALEELEAAVRELAAELVDTVVAELDYLVGRITRRHRS